MSQHHDPFSKCDLICSECGEVLIEDELVEWNGEIDTVRSYREHTIQRTVKEHVCFRKAIVTVAPVEPYFQVGQWILNCRTGFMTLLADQALADLMNEQRRQGINKHLEPV